MDSSLFVVHRQQTFTRLRRVRPQTSDTENRRRDIRITGNQGAGDQNNRESGYNPTCSTIVENPLQIGPIMQNKANVKIGSIDRMQKTDVRRQKADDR